MSVLKQGYIGHDLMGELPFLPEFFRKEDLLVICPLSAFASSPAHWQRQASSTLSIVVDFDLPVTAENLDWLTRACLLPAYFKPGNEVTVFSSPDKEARIIQSLASDGFPAARLISVQTLRPLQIGSFHGYIGTGGKEKVIDLIFTSISHPGPYTPEAMQSELELLRGVFALQTGLEEQNVRLAEENKELRETVCGLETEVRNLGQYLEVALRQKETEHILNFYHREYEVLPLWFKRLGHLIKIIQGKRKLHGHEKVY
jgi:hypothetical protein